MIAFAYFAGALFVAAGFVLLMVGIAAHDKMDWNNYDE